MNPTSQHFNPADDRKSHQCEVVLNALRQGPKSTIELRELNVMSPAVRVMEWRRRGLVIDTLRVGRCAVYALREDEGRPQHLNLLGSS